MKYVLITKSGSVQAWNTKEEFDNAVKTLEGNKVKILCKKVIGTEYCNCVENIVDLVNTYIKNMKSNVYMESNGIVNESKDGSEYAYVYFKIDDPFLPDNPTIDLSLAPFTILKGMFENIGITLKKAVYAKEYMLIF